MATITSRDKVDEIIAANGAGSPRVIRIVQYTHAIFGHTCYGLITTLEPLNLYDGSTGAVKNPTIIWDYDDHSKSEKVQPDASDFEGFSTSGKW